MCLSSPGSRREQGGFPSALPQQITTGFGTHTETFHTMSGRFRDKVGCSQLQVGLLEFGVESMLGMGNALKYPVKVHLLRCLIRCCVCRQDGVSIANDLSRGVDARK